MLSSSHSFPSSSSLPSIQHMANHGVGLQRSQTPSRPSAIGVGSPSRAIVCSCSTPNVGHDTNCQVYTLMQQCSPMSSSHTARTPPNASLIRPPHTRLMPPAKVPEQPSNAQQMTSPSQHSPNPMYPSFLMGNPSPTNSQQLPNMSVPPMCPASVSHHQPSIIQHEPMNTDRPGENANAK